MLEHEGIRSLLNGDGYNEWEYRWENDGMNCKCLVDRVTWEKNKITIIDIKTSSKNVRQFILELKKRKNWYVQQLAYYNMGVCHHISQQKKEVVDMEKINWEYYIIYVHQRVEITNPAIYLLKIEMDKEKEVRRIERKMKKISYNIQRKQIEHANGYFEKENVDFILKCR